MWMVHSILTVYALNSKLKGCKCSFQFFFFSILLYPELKTVVDIYSRTNRPAIP